MRHRAVRLLAAAAALWAGTAAAAVSPDVLIDMIFGERALSVEFDTNGDGFINAADLTGYALHAFPTPGPSDTPTETVTPLPSDTPLPTATATPTPEPTPIPGLLFGGTTTALAPHGMGDTFQYRITDTRGPRPNETYTVVSDSDTEFVIDLQQGNLHRRITYADDGMQVLLVSTNDLVTSTLMTCDVGILQFAAPVIQGEAASSSSNCQLQTTDGHFVGSLTEAVVVTPFAGVGSLTVANHTYSNVVELHGVVMVASSGTTTEEDHDAFLAPGVGLVREVVSTSAFTQTRELTSATIGGHPVP